MDIAERKRMEAALIESGDLFEALAEGMAAAAFVCQEEKVVYVNPAMLAMSGYSKEEFVSMNFWDIIHKDFCSTMKKMGMYRQCGEDGHPRYEFKIVRKDGLERWISFSTGTFTYKGMPAAICSAFDITEQKLSEEKTRSSEEKYRDILESIHEGYFEVDLTGNLTFLNHSLSRILGYNDHDWRGVNYNAFVAEHDKRKVYKTFNTVYRTDGLVNGFDWELKKTDGASSFVETSVKLLKNKKGVPIGFRGIIKDVTDRKNAEQALKESEERYRTLAERSFAGVYVVQNGTFKFLNSNMTNYLGYTPDELLERESLSIVHPDDRDKVRDHNKKILLGMSDIPNEFRIIRKSGEIRWLIETVSTIHFRGKRAVLGNCMDITERKLTENKLRYLSTHDVLTGLYNRAYFEEELKRLEQGRIFPVGVVVADIDNLKKVNDTQGHAAGDELIKRAAKVMQDSFRMQDVLARSGGDEFAALLPGADDAVAERIIVRVREMLEVHNRMFNDCPMGISLGYAVGLKGNKLSEILKIADQHMYQEKLSHMKISKRCIES